MTSLPLFEPWFRESYADAVRDQALSGWVGPGPTTNKFAEEICAYTGAAHCLPTVSGTVALSAAAVALGLQPGDEILVPAYGVISTINAFAVLGLRPRLVDIERETGCMSPSELRRAIGPKTRAVCFVNFSGYTGANLVEVSRICEAYGLPLIEDAACAFGQTWKGQAAGTFGTMGVYSFSVPKIISTGQGGAVVTASRELYEKAFCYTDQGDMNWRKTNVNHSIGSNLRFNDILAAFGLAQLQDIEARLERKRAAHNVLKEAFGPHLFTTPGENAPLHNVVFSPESAHLIAHLKEAGIATVQPYRTLSQHPPYTHLGADGFPNADYWTEQAIYLPFGLTLTATDAETIAAAVFSAGVTLDSLDQDANTLPHWEDHRMIAA